MAFEIAGMFGGVGATISKVFINLLYIVPLLLVGGYFMIKAREKQIYTFQVRILKLRANGKVKEFNTVGGYVGRKNSAPFFRIKMGKMWWQVLDLNKTPNPALIDEDDRVHYLQIDVNSYIQSKRDLSEIHGLFAKIKAIAKDTLEKDKGAKIDLIQIGKKLDTATVKYTPIETDIKYGAILSIQRIKEVLRSEPAWKRVLPYAGLIILAVVFIAAYAMLMQSCGS